MKKIIAGMVLGLMLAGTAYAERTWVLEESNIGRWTSVVSVHTSAVDCMRAKQERIEGYMYLPKMATDGTLTAQLNEGGSSVTLRVPGQPTIIMSVQCLVENR